MDIKECERLLKLLDDKGAMYAFVRATAPDNGMLADPDPDTPIGICVANDLVIAVAGTFRTSYTTSDGRILCKYMLTPKGETLLAYQRLIYNRKER